MSIMTVKDLKKKAPKGEFLAYINKEEAAALKRAGGSGHLVNGIPSFVGSDYSGGGKDGKKGTNTSGYQGGMRGKGGYQGSTGETNKTKSEGGTGDGNFNPNDKAVGTVDPDQAKRVKDKYEKQFYDIGKVPPLGSRPISYATKIAQRNKQKKLNYINSVITSKRKKRNTGIIDYQDEFGNFKNVTDFSPIEDYRSEVQSVKDLVDKGFYSSDGKFSKGAVPDFSTKTGFATADILGNIFGGPITSDKLDELQTDIEKLEGLKTTSGLESTNIKDLMETYQPNRFKRENPDPNEGGGSGRLDQANILPMPVIDTVEPYTNDFTYRMGDNQNVIYENYGTPGYRTTAAEGGIMGTRARRAMGGIMNRVDQRQGYFLGKIVKGVKSAIGGVADAAGKVLKSDVGKMAIAGLGAYYMGGGMGLGGKSMFGNTGFGGSGFMTNLGRMRGSLFGQAGSRVGQGSVPFKEGLLTKFGLTKGGGSFMPTLLGAGVLGLGGAALMGPAKQDPSIIGDRGGRLKDSQGNDALPADIRAEIKEAYASGDSDRINAIQDYYAFLPPTNQYLPYPNYAQGGRIGKAEGGLLDMGGMEKDYRAEGGFVPIGEYEKKDDVPARLSVNEFVFTADAVRGAGQGDIDKGAEIMENMMENLENGGTVSEESQGNKGAQQMFKTSERLGAVI